MKLETMAFHTLELKALAASKEFPNGGVSGYASTYEVDHGGDRVLPGAFRNFLAEGLKNGKIKLVAGHDYGIEGIIGVLTKAEEDERGLFIEARFSAVQAAQDVRTKIAEGILDSFSIGYNATKHRMNADVRELQELRLYEVSVVPWPMNAGAGITSVKSEDLAKLNELKNTLHLCTARTQVALAALRK